MGKKIQLESDIIKLIINDAEKISIRNLEKKYSLNKNVILRVIRNHNKTINNDIDHIVCKRTNKKFNDFNNKSGIITKHLTTLNIVYDKKTYLKNFNIIYTNKFLSDFESFIKSLRKKYEKKIIINGIYKFYFQTNKINIFFIDNEIISNNEKIKPIFLSKLNNRYDNTLFFYSDEWVYKQNVVKSKINYSLKTYDKNKIYARKCTIKIIDPKTKNKFLERNHIQGKCKSIINYGAYYNDKLIAVMCFTNNRSLTNDKVIFDYELIRYSTDINCYLIGGASKLLSFFKKDVGVNKKIISFGDKRFILNRKNNLYDKLGFSLISTSKHDFSLIEKNSIIRIHKFGIQIKNKYDEDKYKNYKKLWDCGKYKYYMST